MSVSEGWISQRARMCEVSSDGGDANRRSVGLAKEQNGRASKTSSKKNRPKKLKALHDFCTGIYSVHGRAYDSA